MSRPILRQPNFLILIGLTWLVVVTALLLVHWPKTAETLFDTDDAMRLVQLRDWLAKGPIKAWFDLHQPRMFPPDGYDTHWSRLIDAGLASLFAIFSLFADVASAERLMRAWWPLLWLLPTIGAMASVAWRIGGRSAATLSLLLAVAGVPAYQQFTPGRIDHHNVQIALTLLAVAATVWSDRVRWAAGASGALTGAALSIGFECAPYLIVCGAALAFRFFADRDAGRDLSNYGIAMVMTASAGFLATVGPTYWGRHACDSLALNTVAAVAAAGIALALSGWLQPERLLNRGVVLVAAASVSAAVLIAVEPACLRGPFGMIDPAIRPIWLDGVREMQPLSAVFRTNPLTGAAIAAFPALGVLAALFLVTRHRAWADFALLATTASFLVAVAVTIGAIRGFSYAMWLGMPLVAAMAERMFDALRLRAAWSRALAMLLLTPLGLSTGAIALADASGLADRDPFDRPDVKACTQSASYRWLASLPPGIVAADIGFGPHVLALTPHSVLAGPYHQLSRGIVAAHQSLALPPAQAFEVLKANRVTYVLLCGSRPPDGLDPNQREQSLWGRLRAGQIPPFLDQLAGGAAQPFAVFRVRPETLPGRPSNSLS